jgi:O-antigen/teichoic acid export membrane protein
MLNAEIADVKPEAALQTPSPKRFSRRGNALQLSRHALLYILSNGLQRGATIIILPLLLTRLTIEEYGQYGLLLSVYALVPAIISLALFGAIGRFYFDSNKPERQKQIISTLLISNVTLALLITAALDLSLTAMVETIGGVEYRPFIRLTIWAATATVIYEGVIAFWRAAEKSSRVVLAQVSSFVLTTSAIAFFLIHEKLGLKGVLLGLLIGQGIISIVALTTALLETGLAWERPLLWGALAYSTPLIPHMVIGWVLRASDRWILEHFRGAQELGTYFFSYQLSSAVSLVMFATNDALVQRFLASYRDGGAAGANSFHRRTFPLYCLAVVVLAVGVLLGAFLLASLLSRGKVAHNPQLTSIVTAAIVASVLYIPFANAFSALKATTTLTILSTSCGLLNLCFNFLLVPKLGALGAAISMLASYVILLGLVIKMAHKKLGLEPHYAHLGAVGIVLAALIWVFSV